MEKILGTEFSTIYFNECSQIPYRSVTIALTRLSEKNSLQKKAYYDMNPASKKSWTYRMFIKFENPETGDPIDPLNYPSIVMNPADNLDNIDQDYISEILGQLPSKERMRFEHGLFQETDDKLVYYAFDRDKHMEEFTPPKDVEYNIGMDFNITPLTAVIGYMHQGKIYIEKELFLINSNTYEASDKLIEMGLFGAKVIPDSTGSARKTTGKSDHIILKEKGFNLVRFRNPAVKDRVNNVNRLLEQGRLIIHKRCINLRKDLEQAAWLEGPKPELDKKSDLLLNQIGDSLGYLLFWLQPIRSTNDQSFEINL